MAPVRKQRERGGAVGVATRSRVAGSGGLCGSSEMGTSLDIKIKRANKVYHAGVSGGATPQSCAMTAGASAGGRAGRAVAPNGAAEGVLQALVSPTKWF